ncbi:hypothetical protein HZP59_08695 [Elizabethkingia anophelis]|nr:hypothetical protein [Elizabethkingia anophelis]
MKYKQYKDFHDKFTHENQFEFSYGIYLARDFVRNREINIKILNEFFELLKTTPEINLVLDYLKTKNINSKVTQKAINYIITNL